MKQILSFLILFTCISAFCQESMNMQLLFNWDDDAIPGTTQYDNPYNEIWGYAAEGREYAIIGSTLGTHIFDVTDPANSVEVDFVAGAAQGGAIVHRDYHDYGGYLYMACQEGLSTLQIADLSYLPDSVHVVYDSDEIFRGAHNIFIDESQALMYAMDVIRVGSGFIGLQIISLEDPANPELINELINGDVHDIFVRDNLGYLNRGSGGRVEVYDFSDPMNPVELGELNAYPGQGYNHSGYLSEDGTVYIMGDETWGTPLKVLDVSDPTDIQVLSTMETGIATLSIPHNQILHNHLAWSSYYYDGVYAWDISDPENPVLAAFYDTTELAHTNNYEGCWGVYPFLPSGNILVSDMQNGLFVLSNDYVQSVVENGAQEASFFVYPNPSNKEISIRLKGKELHKVVLRDTQGSAIKEWKAQAIAQPLSLVGLASGMYFLEAQFANGRVTQCIIKE